MKFISTRRIGLSLPLAIALVAYSFLFVPRNINILTTRTPLVKVLDFALNLVLFFVVIYLVASFLAYLIEIIFRPKK